MFSDEFIEKMTANGAIIGYAAEFNFPSGTMRNHTGVGEVFIDGVTYYGLGEMGSVGTVENVSDANPASVDLTLVGIPSQVFSAVLQSNIRGSNVEVMKVVYSSNGMVLAAEPIVIGQVVDYNWTLEQTGTITISVADEFNLYERPLQKYYTQASWKKDHPGDNFWQYVAKLASKTVYWGNKQDGEKLS
jgi:hypothetical protein